MVGHCACMHTYLCAFPGERGEHPSSGRAPQHATLQSLRVHTPLPSLAQAKVVPGNDHRPPTNIKACFHKGEAPLLHGSDSLCCWYQEEVAGHCTQ